MFMNDKEQKDRVRGSLVGGAIGDALGYPVEFIFTYEEIQRRLTGHWAPAFCITHR